MTTDKNDGQPTPEDDAVTADVPVEENSADVPASGTPADTTEATAPVDEAHLEEAAPLDEAAAVEAATPPEEAAPADDTAPTAGETPVEGVIPAEPRDSPARPVITLLATAAALAAFVAAIVFGAHGFQMYFVERPASAARDGAVDGAETAILNVTTVDPTDTKEWKERVDASLTGEAAEEITEQQIAQLDEMIASAGPGGAAALSSRLVRSAPVEVNDDEGKAKVLVYVDTTSKRPDVEEAGVTQRMGFLVSVTRQGDRWVAEKIDSLNALTLEQDMNDAAEQGEQNPGGN